MTLMFQMIFKHYAQNKSFKTDMETRLKITLITINFKQYISLIYIISNFEIFNSNV